MQPPAAPPSTAPSPLFLLCGGGTGGHVYPALAVAEALRARFARAAEGSLAYVGRDQSIEERIIAREGQLPFYALPAEPLRGRTPLGVARGVVALGQGIAKARALLGKLQPAAILGTGGYVCVPLFIAARSRGTPTMIYLPDVVPGLAVRLLARIANLSAATTPDSAAYLGFREASDRLPPPQRGANYLLVTGYPVRSALFNRQREACRRAFGLQPNLPSLLVYGGSLGARSINRAVAALLPTLLEQCQIIHICGREGDERWLREAAGRLPSDRAERYRLYPYLESQSEPTMADAFGAADLALCRSGASTLAELPATQLPAVLVPYPYVHQDENADYLVRQGGALKIADGAMIAEGDPRSGELLPTLLALLKDPARRAQMASRMGQLARPDAADRLAHALLNLAGRSLR